MGEGAKASQWVKENIDILIEEMTVLEFNKDYSNYKHISYDEPLSISEEPFKKVRQVLLERKLSTEAVWPYTVENMYAKWLTLQKVYSRCLRVRAKKC